MSKLSGRSSRGDVVSLSERIRYAQLFRVAVIAVVLGAAWLSPSALDVGLQPLLRPTLAYAACVIAGETTWRLWRKRALPVFSLLLIIDGVYLAWVSYLTGGSISPFRYLILLHLITVALLASYRTGLKLALWNSLLLLVVHYGQEAKILSPPTDAVRALPGTDFERLVTFMVVFWLVAVATATFSAINERELRRRRFDLEALAKMAEEIESADDAPEVADVLVDSVVDAFGFERAVVLASPDESLFLMAQRGQVQPVKTGPPVGEGSVLRQALDQRETCLISEFDPEKDPWLAEMLPNAHNLVIVPLTAEGSSVGLLVAEHSFKSGTRIERRVVGMVERFASHGALAIMNAWLLERVQKAATTDGLTMIANRRTFETSLKREINRVSRSGEILSLIMLDIDHFKRLNDTHGHLKGDDVLRRVAAVLEENCRDFDIAARYGGEEFAVIVPGTDTEGAVALGDRLADAIKDSNQDVPVTVSMGVATFPTNAPDPEGVVAAADEALYASKRAGRDRITASERRSNVTSTDPKRAAGAA